MKYEQHKHITNFKKHISLLTVVPFFFIILALSSLSCTQTPPDHQHRVLPAKKGLTSDNQFQVSPEDACPVCGMIVFRYPKSAGAIQLKGERIYYTCGTACLVRFWLDPEGLLGVKKSEIVHLFLQEFFSGNTTEAENIIFVPGSDFIGPMGRDIAPVDPSMVEAFIARHGGIKPFKLKEITNDSWQDIQVAVRNL